MWIGVLPRRSGRANVVCPLPPYIVPRSENSAWFWLMGRNCPLQNAHPLGGKLKLMILISPRYGSDTLAPLCYGVAHDAPPTKPPPPPPTFCAEVTSAPRLLPDTNALTAVVSVFAP